MKQKLELIKHENHLESEKTNFLAICSDFIDNCLLDSQQFEGRPRFKLNDILKSLLIQTLNSLSYRRVKSDLALAKIFGFIDSIPKRSTLNKYMMNANLTNELMRLIQISAMPFLNKEDTLIVDSTWFGLKMYVGGYSNNLSFL